MGRKLATTSPTEPIRLRLRANFIEVRQSIVRSGLLTKQPLYYACIILVVDVLFGSGLLYAVLTQSFWPNLFLVPYMACISAQVAFIVHDAGHKQISSRQLVNSTIGVLHAALLLGVSYSWWVNKHNRHHGRPNEWDADPDIDLPLLALSTEQADEKGGVGRWFVRYQAYLFFPLLAFQALSFKVASIRFLVRQRRGSHSLADMGCLITHYTFIMLVGRAWGLGRTLLMAALYNALLGVYLGSVFATNHLGMPLLVKGEAGDFLTQQVITSRNIRANRVVDFCFGGLSCQIEHHLFPRLPRNRLRQAQVIIRPYCAAKGIEYRELSLLQAYREILKNLHGIGAKLRA